MTKWGLSGSGTRYHIECNKAAYCDRRIFLWDRNLEPIEEKKCKKCLRLLGDNQ